MTVAEFFHMGGYALYVWGSFGMTALVMVVELILLRQRQATARQRVARMIRIDQETNQ